MQSFKNDKTEYTSASSSDPLTLTPHQTEAKEKDQRRNDQMTAELEENSLSSSTNHSGDSQTDEESTVTSRTDDEGEERTDHNLSFC